jgi:signal transduction histidine kinase
MALLESPSRSRLLNLCAIFRKTAAQFSGSRFNSLAARLIAAAAIWTMLALAVGGFFLSNAFRSAVLDNFDTALRTDMDGLIAAAEPDENGGVVLQDRFINRQFDRIYSGLYYQIKPVQAGQAGGQISRSLFDRALVPTGEQKNGALTYGYAAGPENQKLRVVSRRVDLTPDNASNGEYTFLVAGDLAAVDAESAAFNGTLIWSFVVLGLGLVVAILLQVRVGLMPLRRLRESLHRIRDGKAERLEGEFPAEIAPLAAELNSLIEHSAEIVGRARTHVSNLAHFLKTPLSVLASEAEATQDASGDAPGLAAQVRKQIDVMRRQVDHYLARARAAGSVNVLGNRTLVAPVLNDLANVLTRIHASRDIVIDAECPPTLSFRGERQDLEEMAGNLMDNAAKWARHRVRVRAKAEGARLVLSVEDDGPGLSPEDRAKVGERGERLDESVPGTGLGLAIVRDISKLYAGFLTLEDSELGGLKALLTLPALQGG